MALQRRWQRRSVLEGALLLAAICGLSELALISHRPLTYLVFPGLIWAAVRFGPRGATLAIAIVVGFTSLATTHYLGPFAFHSLTRSVLSTKLYIAVAALSTLCFAAVVCEREDLANRLGASRARLVEAADAERSRLEHNLHDGAQQRLTALAVRLGIASGRVRQDPDVAATAIGEAQNELSLAIDELRELAHGIHATVLTRWVLRSPSRAWPSARRFRSSYSSCPPRALGKAPVCRRRRQLRLGSTGGVGGFFDGDNSTTTSLDRPRLKRQRVRNRVARARVRPPSRASVV